jgi:hypothetical protein
MLFARATSWIGRRAGRLAIGLRLFMLAPLLGCEPGGRAASSEIEAGLQESDTRVEAGASSDGARCDAGERCLVTSECRVVPDADDDTRPSIDCGGTDCDDSDPNRYPGNQELCDDEGHDEDCDPTTLAAAPHTGIDDRSDVDGDGYVSARCCNGALCGDDCDDTRSDVHPGAVDLPCDGVDSDCRVDEIDAQYCGACACSLPYAEVRCPAGAEQCAVLACHEGHADCDERAPGCEADLLSASSCGACDVVCDVQASCVMIDGHARCRCVAGYDGSGTACADIDECASDHGGCDPVARCENTPGGRACSCPRPAFGGDGEGNYGCVPALTALAVSEGTLEPQLDADHASYALRLPLASSMLALTPEAAPGVQIAIGGTVVESGALAQLPELSFGPNAIAMELRQQNGPPRSYALAVERGHQEGYLKASNTDSGDYFGRSVAVYGDTLVVGAASEASRGRTADADQDDNRAPSSGAVYVFVRQGARWRQEAYLKAHNADLGDHFGHSVALWGDTLVVGAPEESGAGGDPDDDSLTRSGAAYVYERREGRWTLSAYLKASNAGEGDRFGHSVAISGDRLLVGATSESSADVTAQDDDDVYNAGAAYVFARAGEGWTQEAYLKASVITAGSEFGYSVALAGDVAVVGAPFEALAVEGGESIEYAGAAYAFVRHGSSWIEVARLGSPAPVTGDYFGMSVATSGELIVAGAPNESTSSGQAPDDEDAGSSGAAFVFTRAPEGFVYSSQLKASVVQAGDWFGHAVAASETAIVVGAPGESSSGFGIGADAEDDDAQWSGAVYVFMRDGDALREPAYIKVAEGSTPDPLEFHDGLGVSVAVSGDTIVAGAPYEDSAATGVDGDALDDGAAESGAAYVFR